MRKNIPKIINLEKIGSSQQGYITIAENLKNIPFDIKRVYWTYYTPNEVTRGGHAHKCLEQLIFAVTGTITFDLEDSNGGNHSFELNQPHVGLYLPPYTWREIKFSHNAVLLCLASDLYDEEDYIRNYQDYKECLFQL